MRSDEQHELESRPLEWRSAGTGLCSYRVRGVDGIFRAFNCRILYGLYLPPVILTVIWYSVTHSLFLSRLKTFLLYTNLSHCSPSFLSTEIFTTWIPRTVYCYFWAYLFSTFGFSSSVFTLFSCRLRAVD